MKHVYLPIIFLVLPHAFDAHAMFEYLEDDEDQVEVQPRAPRMSLTSAVRLGDEDEVRLHIELGTDPNEIDAHGNSALMLAASCPTKMPILRMLLDAEGIDVNRTHTDGETILIKALLRSNFLSLPNDPWSRIFFKLMNMRKIDLHQADRYGRTALMIACRNNRADMVRALQARRNLDDSDLGINSTDEHGNTALMIAVENMNIEIVRLLLTEPEINISHINNFGSSALSLTLVPYPQPEVIRMLLAYSHKHSSEYQQTALREARNKRGYTLLQLAVLGERQNAVSALLYPAIDTELGQTAGAGGAGAVCSAGPNLHLSLGGVDPNTRVKR